MVSRIDGFSEDELAGMDLKARIKHEQRPFKSGNPDLFHAEATPHGVNIMTRNDAGMYEHVALFPIQTR
jgi:hypothetical protein